MSEATEENKEVKNEEQPVPQTQVENTAEPDNKRENVEPQKTEQPI